MIQIKESVGNIVAADTQSSVEALDHAIAQQSRLLVSVLEAAQDSNVAMSVTQPLLEALSESVRGLITSRTMLVKAVRAVTVVQAKSNLHTTSFGCPNGFEPKNSKSQLEKLLAQ